MEPDHTPGFERPDFDSLRESFEGLSTWDRIKCRVSHILGIGWLRVLILALLIVVVIGVGYLALT